ncbi:hypothetical protein [Eisenibacter elegans]|jgi:Fe-S cluster assembly scaffold protein SufB|nr:hypothetical protein [Eisenibacter elegans]
MSTQKKKASNKELMEDLEAAVKELKAIHDHRAALLKKVAEKTPQGK